MTKTPFEEIEMPIKKVCTLKEACEWIAFGWPATDEEFKEVYRQAYPYDETLMEMAKAKIKVLIKTKEVRITGRYAFFLFFEEIKTTAPRCPVEAYGTMESIACCKLDLENNRILRLLRGFAEIEVDTRALMRVCPSGNKPLFAYTKSERTVRKEAALPPLLLLIKDVIEEQGYSKDNIPENKVVETALIKKAKETGFEFSSENQIQEAARIANAWTRPTLGRRGKRKEL